MRRQSAAFPGAAATIDTYAGHFSVAGSTSANRVEVIGASFIFAEIKLAGGNDRLPLDGAYGDKLIVDLGAGGDDIFARTDHDLGFNVATSLIDGGSGHDVVYQNETIVNATNAEGFEDWKTLDGR